MRTIEEIKKEIVALITRCPSITDNEIGKQLHLSVRFTEKILNSMIQEGEICLKN